MNKTNILLAVIASIPLICFGTETGVVSRITWEEENLFPSNQAKYLVLRQIDTSPVLDGTLNDSCWKDAAAIPISDSGKIVDATVYLTFDRDFLYCGVTASLGKPLIAKLTAHDGNLWEEDCVEIFIDPWNDHRHYYQFIANPLAAKFDIKGTRSASTQHTSYDIKWDGPWQVSASMDTNKNAWKMEAAIPFSCLGREKPGKGTVMGFNVNVNHGMECFTSWALLRGSHHLVQNYNHIVLGETSVTLRGVDLHPCEGNNVLFVIVENRDSRPCVCAFTVRAGGQQFRETATLNLGRQQVEIGYRLANREQAILELSGNEEKTGTSLFQARYLLDEIDSAVPPLACSIASELFNPGDKIPLRATISNLTLAELAGMKLKLTVTRETRTVASEEWQGIQSRKIALDLDSSRLGTGKYTAGISLVDGKGQIVGNGQSEFVIEKGAFDE